MNSEALKHLMAAILAEQPESAEAGMVLDEARLRRALSEAELLSAAEQHLLWTSPEARRRLTMLWDSQRAAPYLAWRRAGITPQIAYMAAADPVVQPITIDTHPHFTIKLYPLDTDGQRWTIFLKLSDTAHQTLLTGVRLVDTGGLQWLAGPVDGDGELSAEVERIGPITETKAFEQLGILVLDGSGSMSDGQNNRGKNPVEVAERIKQSGKRITVCAVGYGTDRSLDEGPLKQLVSKPQGYKFTMNTNDLRDFFEDTITEVGS